MLSFCVNTVHSLLTLSEEKEEEDEDLPHCGNIPSGLRLLTDECKKPANVVESVSVKKASGELGFLDEIFNTSAGSVMDAMSCCTESLGFESSDQLEDQVGEYKTISRSRSRLRLRKAMESDRRTEEGKNKIFPPPMSSLNQNGHRSFYLKSERKEGRLEITEVRIDRPEILRASRQNGRLTLHLIQPVEESKKEDELNESDKELNDSVEEAKESVESKEEDAIESVQRWNKKFSEISRRCYDLSHHRMPMWSNHCVMTG